MLRNKQHSRKETPPYGVFGGAAAFRAAVLAEMIDGLDLHSFLHEPAYRQRLNEVLDAFSDEEFDSFEQLYTRRFTVN